MKCRATSVAKKLKYLRPLSSFGMFWVYDIMRLVIIVIFTKALMLKMIMMVVTMMTMTVAIHMIMMMTGDDDHDLFGDDHGHNNDYL